MTVGKINMPERKGENGKLTILGRIGEKVNSN